MGESEPDVKNACVSHRRLWLIDAAYLFVGRHSVRSNFQFDYARLREALETDGRIWRGYYLNSSPNPPLEAQDAFHNWLRSARPEGPQLITKLYELQSSTVRSAFCVGCGQQVPVACPNDTTGTHQLVRQVQKGVDVGISTLALTLLDQYDELVLSSGDVDLLDAVEHVLSRSKTLSLAVFRTGVSTELQSRADKIRWIDDLADVVEKHQ